MPEGVIADETVPAERNGGKVLIAYFSWGGNTRGIAREIHSQTGADLFEITPVNPYSTDYNTVLMEAQEDQHRQARPELSEHIENMDEYDWRREVRAESDSHCQAGSGCGDGRRIVGTLLRRICSHRRCDCLA